MFKHSLVDNKQGQVFSLDVMFALIIITVILGLSANALDTVGFKITDYSSSKSLDRITVETADILVNTPGSPENWEEKNLSAASVTPGLAEKNSEKGNTKILSIKKIYKLQNKYQELMEGKMIPKGAKSSLIIYPTDPAFETIVIMDGNSLNDEKEVSVANRTVLCDFSSLYSIYSTIIMNKYFENDNEIFCPHHGIKGIMEHQRPDFNLKTDGWICNNFEVKQKDLMGTDFYLITDPTVNDNQARWVIDRPENMTDDGQRFTGNPINVNQRISQLLGDDDQALLWLHILTSGDGSKSFNVYIVGVPKGTSLEKIKVEYMNPQPCFFILKVSM